MPKKETTSLAAELRRTKQELAAMRARYFDLYDLAPAGIFTLGETGLILEANLTLAVLLGAPKPSLLKRPLSGFILPEDLDLFERHRERFTEKNAPPALELRMLRAKSAPFWARLELTLGHDAGGALLYRVVLSDITERVRTQQDLLRQRAAVDHAHDGIAVADMEGRIQFVNLAWAKMHGWSKEELLGRHLSIFHTKEQLENDVVPFNENVFAKGSWAGEVGHVHKDGTIIPCWMSTVLLRDADGKVTGLVGMASDITARRAADEYLARVLSEREAILKSIPDLFYRLDADMNLQDWNHVFEILSGYPPQQLKGMSALEFFKTDRKVIAEGIQEAVVKGKAYRTGRFLTRRGEEIPVFWSAAALRAPDGRLMGLVGIGRDLTAK
jgi:PAS domain S-box-containing protein